MQSIRRRTLRVESLAHVVQVDAAAAALHPDALRTRTAFAVPAAMQAAGSRSPHRACQFVLGAGRLEADLRAVADPGDPDSAVTSAARFVVAAGQPVVERA